MRTNSAVQVSQRCVITVVDTGDERMIFVDGADGEPIARVYDTPWADSNASLIVDALNVRVETGLTPLQLAEQRAGLLEALQMFVAAYEADDICAMADVCRSKASAAIAKATGGAP